MARFDLRAVFGIRFYIAVKTIYQEKILFIMRCRCLRKSNFRPGRDIPEKVGGLFIALRLTGCTGVVQTPLKEKGVTEKRRKAPAFRHGEDVKGLNIGENL